MKIKKKKSRLRNIEKLNYNYISAGTADIINKNLFKNL